MKLAGAIFVLFLLISFGQINAQSTETKIFSGIGFDGEPNLVANPSDPRQMVVAWMGLGLNGSTAIITIKTRSSSDGGKTWSSVVSLPHFSNDWGSADPTMVYHKSGKLYLVYIDYKQAEDSGGVYLMSSANNGLSWSFESKIIDIQESPKLPLDRPWISIDNSGGTYDGTLFVTTKPAPWIPAPNRPYFKVSSDAKNWSTLRFLDTTNYLVGNFIQAPMAACGATKDGILVAAYPSYLTSQSVYPKYFLAKSADGGSTFSYQDLLVNPGNSGDTNLKAGYQLLPDLWNANRIVFLRIDNKAGDADVVVNATWDQGANWTSTTRVNDDAVGSGKLQDLAWSDWSENGELLVCWRDRRNGSGTGFAQSTDCYCAVSTDSGKTFEKNIRMTSQSAPYHAILTQNGNDFMGAHIYGDTIIAVWGDVRNSKLELWQSTANWKNNTGGVEKLIVQEDINPIQIWPNPSRDEINISALYTIDFPLIVMNSMGEKVAEITASDLGKLDVSSFAAGNYYIHVNSSIGNFTAGFAVVK